MPKGCEVQRNRRFWPKEKRERENDRERERERERERGRDREGERVCVRVFVCVLSHSFCPNKCYEVPSLKRIRMYVCVVHVCVLRLELKHYLKNIRWVCCHVS